MKMSKMKMDMKTQSSLSIKKDSISEVSDSIMTYQELSIL